MPTDSRGRTVSAKSSTQSFSLDREECVRFVESHLRRKGLVSPSTTITRLERLEASCVVTAITESSDGIGTRIYFEGSLTI